jgi:hypothetical protein
VRELGEVVINCPDRVLAGAVINCLGKRKNKWDYPLGVVVVNSPGFPRE